jgi:hypothetical protein
VSSTTVTLRPAETAAVDVYIRSSVGSINEERLIIGHDGSTQYRTIMAWDLTSIHTSATVTAATLTLTEESNQYTESQSIRIYRLTQSGVDERADWDTYDGDENWTAAGGDYTTTGGASESVSSSAGDLVVNSTEFTALVQSAIDDYSGYLRIILITDQDLAGETTGRERGRYYQSYTSTEANRPALEITYTADQTTPEHLVIGLLDAASDVTDVVSNRISAGYREALDELPCIIVETDSIDADDSLTGSSSVDIAYVEVSCVAATYTAASSLGNSVLQALAGDTGTTAQGETYSVSASHGGARIESMPDGTTIVIYPINCTAYLER